MALVSNLSNVSRLLHHSKPTVRHYLCCSKRNHKFPTSSSLEEGHKYLSFVFERFRCPFRTAVIQRSLWTWLFTNTKSLERVIGKGARYSVSKLPFHINKNLAQDVLVYSYKNDNFYKVLSFFGVVQMLMWIHLSLFSAQQLRTAPASISGDSDLPWWKRLLYKEGHYKNAISILGLSVGFAILFITLTYPRRAIQSLWMLRGGQDVNITTYAWFGRTHSFRTSVENISCMQARTSSGKQVPLKVKGKNFFFLIDKNGTFHNTDIFDFVIGLKRNF